MIGWRARLGFMVPPGNPTIEPEMIALAPQGVSLHFHRMDLAAACPARSTTRTAHARDDRQPRRAVPLLAAVKPDIIAIAHTATSYYLGREHEAALLARLTAPRARRSSAPSRRSPPRSNGSASGGSLSARRIRPRRRRRAAPISKRTASLSSGGKPEGGDEHLRRDRRARLPPGRAHRRRGRRGVFLTGTGMPTLPVLDMLEADLGKPVISSASAMMWHALRRCGVRQKIAGYGRLLTLE